MENDNNEIIDSPNDTVEDTVIIPDDSQEDIEALKEQNKKLFARAKKAEGFVQDASGNWVKKEKPNIISQEQPKPYNILDDEVADLILEGYSKDETRFILANGGRKALEDKDSFVSVAIKTKRAQNKVEDAVSQTTSSGFASGGKTYTEEQLKNMSVEELERILPHA